MGRIIKNSFFSIISLILILSFFVLCELVLRWLKPGDVNKVASEEIVSEHEYSEIYGWDLKEKIPLQVKKRNLPIKNLTKILMLGDSITSGFPGNRNDSFSSILDVNNQNLDVLNIGIQGYGTDQALLKYKNEGYRYSPDIVILNFCLNNDFLDNSAKKFIYDNVFPKPFFSIHKNNLIENDKHLKISFLKKMAFFLAQRSLLFNQLLDLFTIDRNDFKQKVITISDKPKLDDNKKLTSMLIQKISQLVTERGGKFMVLVYPDFKNFKKPKELSELFDYNIVEKEIIIDLRPHYKKNGMKVDNFYEYAHDEIFHLTEKGHLVTAKIIQSILLERKLLR